MSKSGTQGFIGFQKQSAKGATTTTLKYIRATAINLNPDELIDTAAPSIGSTSPFPQEGFKAGYRVGGDFGFEARGDAIGTLLAGLAGEDDQTGNGVKIHTFTMKADKFDLPWMCFVKNTGDVLGEEFSDAKIATLRFTVTTQRPAACTVGIVGSAMEVVTLADYTEDYDVSPLLMSFGGWVKVDYKDNASMETLKAESADIVFTNQLTNDEWVIGAQTLDDITLLARTVGLTIRTKFVDDELYKYLVYGGGTTWGTTPMAGEAQVKVASSANIDGEAEPYSLIFNFGKIMFTGMPIPLAPQGLIRMDLTGQLVLPAAGDEFSIVLSNNVEGEYDA